jgi:hypothetical protein
MDRIENTAPNISYIHAYVFVAAGTVLPRCCLVTIGGGGSLQTDNKVISKGLFYLFIFKMRKVGQKMSLCLSENIASP